MTQLNALDWAMVKIARLERENESKEIRLTALRCRLKELLDNPTLVIVRENELC